MFCGLFLSVFYITHQVSYEHKAILRRSKMDEWKKRSQIQFVYAGFCYLIYFLFSMRARCYSSRDLSRESKLIHFTWKRMGENYEWKMSARFFYSWCAAFSFRRAIETCSISLVLSDCDAHEELIGFRQNKSCQILNQTWSSSAFLITLFDAIPSNKFKFIQIFSSKLESNFEIRVTAITFQWIASRGFRIQSTNLVHSSIWWHSRQCPFYFSVASSRAIRYQKTITDTNLRNVNKNYLDHKINEQLRSHFI